MFQPKLGFVDAKFLPIFVFLSIILATDMLESHSRALKTFCLVSEKNLSQKNGSIGWGPGPGKSGQKNTKIPPLMTFPPANTKPKIK